MRESPARYGRLGRSVKVLVVCRVLFTMAYNYLAGAKLYFACFVEDQILLRMADENESVNANNDNASHSKF